MGVHYFLQSKITRRGWGFSDTSTCGGSEAFWVRETLGDYMV